jgi:hypothetical protein
MTYHPRALALAAFIACAVANQVSAQRIPIRPVRHPPLAIFDETQDQYVERLSRTIQAVDCGKDGLDGGDIALVMKARDGRRAAGSALPGACFPLSPSPEGQIFGDPPPALASAVIYGSARSTYYDFHGLMRTRPGRDGKITDLEVRRLARRTFREVDRNRDGTVDPEERGAWSLAACGWPAPQRNDTILLVGVYSGEQLSTVSVAGQDRPTELIDVEISPGAGRLYVIATSTHGMIWRVSGATERVSTFVAHSSTQGDTDQPAAGVAGLAANKAYVLPSGDCWKGQSGVTPTSANAGAEAVFSALGRSPTEVFETGKAGRLLLPEGIWSNAPRATESAPEGFDQERWREAILYWRGGLATPETRSIVSREQAEPYEVLPAGFGIAQLVGQGLIEVVGSGDLRIVAPIPRYPAGLSGGHSVRFRLAPGIGEPHGYSGHSSIVDDLTGEPLFNPSWVCRQPRC